MIYPNCAIIITVKELSRKDMSPLNTVGNAPRLENTNINISACRKDAISTWLTGRRIRAVLMVPKHQTVTEKDAHSKPTKVDYVGGINQIMFPRNVAISTVQDLLTNTVPSAMNAQIVEVISILASMKDARSMQLLMGGVAVTILFRDQYATWKDARG